MSSDAHELKSISVSSLANSNAKMPEQEGPDLALMNYEATTKISKLESNANLMTQDASPSDSKTSEPTHTM